MEEPPPVILHVDMDCFYAAVEQVRLNIPWDQPLAVQQWEGLIAVNYAARAAGVVRHDRVSEALHKCPSLQLVHVETIGDDQSLGVAARRNTMKVSLERYRQASKCVFYIFHQYADICERASVDEAYLDVTKKVDSLLRKDYDWDKELQRLSGSGVPVLGENTNMIVENGSIEVCDPLCRRLLAGAIIAEQIRNDVRCKLGYTCSVGIATNKLLAKIASARNKPDKQTLISPIADVAEFMDRFPLKKVKLLGGKIGEQLREKWSCQTAGDVQKIPIEVLISSFGVRLGNYLYKAVRGIYEDKVQEKQMTKSMLAAKSFRSTKDISVIRKWLGILCDELAIRMLDDARENSRIPQHMQLYYRSGLSQQSGDHSKSCNTPHTILQLLRATTSKSPPITTSSEYAMIKGKRSADMMMLESSGESDERSDSSNTDIEKNVPDETTKILSDLLHQASLGLFKRIEDPFPCTRLAIAASGFQGYQLQQGYQSISHFFQSTNRDVKEQSTLKTPKNQLPHSNNLQSYFTKESGQRTIFPKEEQHLCEGVSAFQNGYDPASYFFQSSNRGMKGVCNDNLPNSNNVQGDLPKEATFPNEEQHLCEEDSAFENAHFAESSEPQESSLLQQSIESKNPSDADLCVDLGSVDVVQQQHILEEIYATRVGGEGRNMSSNGDTRSSCRKGALKQRKLNCCESKSIVQGTLSKYFHGRDKK